MGLFKWVKTKREKNAHKFMIKCRIETLEECAPPFSYTVNHDENCIIFHDLGKIISLSELAQMSEAEFADLGVQLWLKVQSVDPTTLTTREQANLYRVLILKKP